MVIRFFWLPTAATGAAPVSTRNGPEKYYLDMAQKNKNSRANSEVEIAAAISRPNKGD